MTTSILRGLFWTLTTAILAGWALAPARVQAAEDVVVQIVMVEDTDEEPAAAGKKAAEQLKKAMGDTPLKAVIMSECFEDKEYKDELLEGICSVLPPEVVMGGATYGSFTQDGCTDFDAVCLMGIGGDGVGVSARLVTDMGTSKLALDTEEDLIRERLHAAGKKLAESLRRTEKDRLMILIADAHSPKNRYLVEGVQQVVGNQFPITGGCANKNAGQTFVCFKGKLYEDAAVAVMLSGDFSISLSGRMANVGDQVIATAADGAKEALEGLEGEPIAVIAFNCAGRRSKLTKYEDELAAMQKVLGTELPLFGCYCAGEIGPLDSSEAQPGVRCGGSGWHVMFTVLGR